MAGEDGEDVGFGETFFAVDAEGVDQVADSIFDGGSGVFLGGEGGGERGVFGGVGVGRGVLLLGGRGVFFGLGEGISF